MTVRSPKYYQLNIFTTIGSNVVIWLTNLPLSIGVQTTLLASGCHDLGHALKESIYLTTILWLKANWLWSSVVCTIIDKDIRHHSGHCNLYSYLQRFSLIHRTTVDLKFINREFLWDPLSLLLILRLMQFLVILREFCRLLLGILITLSKIPANLRIS